MSFTLLSEHKAMVEECKVKNREVYRTLHSAVQRHLAPRLWKSCCGVQCSDSRHSHSSQSRVFDCCASGMGPPVRFTVKCIWIYGASIFCALHPCILLHPLLEALDWPASVHRSAPLFQWLLEVFKHYWEKLIQDICWGQFPQYLLYL